MAIARFTLSRRRCNDDSHVGSGGTGGELQGGGGSQLLIVRYGHCRVLCEG